MASTYRQKHNPTSKLPHPTCFELNAKFTVLNKTMDEIFDIADQDMVITVTDSGKPDITANSKLSQCMLELSKSLFALGQQCLDKADELTDRVNRYQEKFSESDKIQFVTEITNPVLKDAICQLRVPIPVKKNGDVTWQVKQEIPVIIYSDSDSDDEKQFNFWWRP